MAKRAFNFGQDLLPELIQGAVVPLLWICSHIGHHEPIFMALRCVLRNFFAGDVDVHCGVLTR